MSELKTKIIGRILGVEGGYVNDPKDSGGATNFGITEKVARRVGYRGHMRDLPRGVAFDIYASRYWDTVNADALATISGDLAEEVVDTAVNLGTGRAGEFLQRSLNVLNLGGGLYADLIIDGSIGPDTLSAVQGYAKVRRVEVLIKALNCLQGAFYIDLAGRRAKDEKFIYGWLSQRV